MTSGVLRSTSTLTAVLEDISVAAIAGNDRQVLVTTTEGRVMVAETAPLPAAQVKWFYINIIMVYYVIFNMV